MPLPLDDKANRLVTPKKTIQEQCLLLINWKKERFLPLDIFSLQTPYSKKDIKAAYKQLVLYFHPDRNKENEYHANEALKVINEAAKYLEFGFEIKINRDDLESNSFYQELGREGFIQKKSNKGQSYDFYAAHHFTRNVRANPQKNSKHQMDFFELAREIKSSPIPEEIITRLKQLIMQDKRLLHTSVLSESPETNILHIVALHGDSEFTLWLINQGADPFIKASRSHLDLDWSYDAASLAGKSGKLDVLRYLLSRHGIKIFYKECRDVLKPQWWRFKDAIRCNQAEIAYFFLEATGFKSYLGDRKFDFEWRAALNKNTNKSEITKLILEFDLLTDIKQRIISAAHHGNFQVVEQLLAKNPQIKINITNFFKVLIRSNEITLDETIIGIRNFLDCHKLSLVQLYSALMELISWYKKIPLNYYFDNAVPGNSKGKVLSLIIKVFVLIKENTNLIKEDLDEDQLMLALQERESYLLMTYGFIIKHSLYKELTSLIACASNSLRSLIAITYLNRAIYDTTANNDEARQKTLYLLIEIGGAALSACTKNTYFPDYTSDIQYLNYTPIQMACELSLNEVAVILLEKMRLEHVGFDNVSLKKERSAKSNLQEQKIFDLDIDSSAVDHSFSKYKYTCLHLAIVKNNQDLAVRLIEAGADINIKAEIKLTKINRCCFFSTKPVEKTPLQMALESKQIKIIHALQLAMLHEYISNRNKDEEYIHCISLFGFILLRLGYSKTQKLQAANELALFLNKQPSDPSDFKKINKGAMNQGRLGAITRLTHHLNTHRSVDMHPSMK
ncbi:MAG: DnaJ domain-containing protein [Legionella sp.]|nr:DnaJ domain-containing protein [Legionella sp.]